VTGFEQQSRPNGHARVLYQPRRDPVIQQHALELGSHCARVVLQGVDAVSPHQKDPDGHRLLVATELTQAMLAEVYRMVGAVTGWALEQRLSAAGGPAYGQVAAAAGRTAPPPRRGVQAAPRGQRRTPVTRSQQRVPRQAVVNRRGF
jgi:hypothetical protein